LIADSFDQHDRPAIDSGDVYKPSEDVMREPVS
jgi:hypothetical protein